jgi:hypothetical protein
MFESGGRHCNRGQRAFFFALGYLAWFVSPWVLFVLTALVVVVILGGSSPPTPGWRWRAHDPESGNRFSEEIMRKQKSYELKSCGVKDRSSTFHSP